jgi:hypothetical protein
MTTKQATEKAFQWTRLYFLSRGRGRHITHQQFINIYHMALSHYLKQVTE